MAGGGDSRTAKRPPRSLDIKKPSARGQGLFDDFVIGLSAFLEDLAATYSPVP